MSHNNEGQTRVLNHVQGKSRGGETAVNYGEKAGL